jgi:von Willebrand factor type A domain
MFLVNLTLGQLLVLFTSASAFVLALYLLDRSRRRQVVATLRFWISAGQPPEAHKRKHIEQPFSLLLQLLGILLLLLAIAQLRWGLPGAQPRDHVLVLDTSSWMAARSPNSTPGNVTNLMQEARQVALRYIRALPDSDRVMLVRADGLATPATPFQPLSTGEDRRVVEAAVNASQPGATALNLDQALAFAAGIQGQDARRPGEIVYAGPGRLGEGDPSRASQVAVKNLRILPVADSAENAGLRKFGLRRSAAESDLWEISVYARNYGTRPRAASVALGFGSSTSGAGAVPIASRAVTLAPGVEQEVTFRHRTRAAGLVEVRIFPADAFPGDDRGVIELPAQKSLQVTVYSDQPDLLRPMLRANSSVNAAYKTIAEYNAEDGAQLVILDRFAPARRPRADALWIDPPSPGSPVPVRQRVQAALFESWRADHPLGAGLRTRDFRLESGSVFEAAPTDIRIGEVAEGPVIVARPGKPKHIVLGFHPGQSALRYELATPLLFANMLRWVSPEIFRESELTAGSPGAAAVKVGLETKAEEIRVLREDGKDLPFTLRDGMLRFFLGERGTVRAIAGDREYIYAMHLPQLWDTVWEAPKDARRGLPRFEAASLLALDLWPWLALLGGLCLLADWLLYGELRRTGLRAPVTLRPAPRRAV